MFIEISTGIVREFSGFKRTAMTSYYGTSIECERRFRKPLLNLKIKWQGLIK